ncbi:MAG: SCP2 sterol-binding domain-containing protein [Polyangiaceae bacterium]|nr:SCP2 sterol-binding domain-containing protein [Polyangiaceae bacterium]
MEPSVELAPGTESNAFADMLAQLVRQNLDDHPEKKATLLRMRGRVAIVIDDLGLAVTLLFEEGRMRVHDGIFGVPDATLRTTSDYVMKMSLVELEPRTGLPDPRGEVAREVWAASQRGEIRVLGLLTSLGLLVRLTRVMSVH